MEDRKEVRGVGDIRTALSGRIRSTPAQKGTTHRDLYLLGEVRGRLEQEIWRLRRQQRRVEARLAEAVRAIARLCQEVEQADRSASAAAAPVPGEPAPGPAAEDRGRRWRKITLGY